MKTLLIVVLAAVFPLAACSDSSSAGGIAAELAEALTDAMDFEGEQNTREGDPPPAHPDDLAYPQISGLKAPQTLLPGQTFSITLTLSSEAAAHSGVVIHVQKAERFIVLDPDDATDDTKVVLAGRLNEVPELLGASFTIGVALIDADGNAGNYAIWNVDVEANRGCSDDCTGPVAADVTCEDGWCRIPPGCFCMGSEESLAIREQDETPHEVHLSRAFEIAVYEVTGELYEEKLGYNPSYFGPNREDVCSSFCPVESTSFYDALAMANAYSASMGLEICYLLDNIMCADGAQVGDQVEQCYQAIHAIQEIGGEQRGIVSADVTLNADSVYDCVGYRLPTEAEWEYAARAGEPGLIYGGDLTETDCDTLDPALDATAWYCANSDLHTHSVGEKEPNAWGLYDMLGNAFEWTWDWYGEYPEKAVLDPVGPSEGQIKVPRGGSATRDGFDCRLPARGQIGPQVNDWDNGIRLVRTVE